jgi:hypothetical protein
MQLGMWVRYAYAVYAASGVFFRAETVFGWIRFNPPSLHLSALAVAPCLAPSPDTLFHVFFGSRKTIPACNVSDIRKTSESDS